MVAYPDRCEGNDPEPFFFFFFFFFFFSWVGSLSQPRLNIFTVDNMGVMICLGQGGLRSLSASSLSFVTLSFFIMLPFCVMVIILFPSFLSVQKCVQCLIDWASVGVLQRFSGGEILTPFLGKIAILKCSLFILLQRFFVVALADWHQAICRCLDLIFSPII